MREAMMIGVVLAFTGLMLLFRSLVFRRRVGKPYRVKDRTDGDSGQHDSNSSDEWPTDIVGEQDSASETWSISEEKRIEMAAMHDRIIRMLP